MVCKNNGLFSPLGTRLNKRFYRGVPILERQLEFYTSRVKHLTKCGEHMKALVLAAGLGSRLNPITMTRPKHLITIAGKSILERILENIAKLGIKEVGIVVHHYANKVKERIGDGSRWGLNIEYIYQPVLNGTAGAVEIAKDFVGNEDVLVIYGDVTLDENVMKDFIKYYEEKNPDAIILGVRVPNPREFGVIVSERGMLVDILEKPKIEKIPSNLINAGIYVFKPKIFDILERVTLSPRGEKELTDALKLLAKIGVVLVYDGGSGWWFDIGRPWDLLDASKKFLHELKPQIKIKNTSNVLIIGDVVIEEGTEIKPGTVIEGPVYIGRDVIIGYNSVIGPYTSIGDNVEIGPLSYIQGSIIMDNTKISSHCSVFESIIGEGVYLESGVKIPALNIYGGSVKVWIKGKKVDSGRVRLGAIIGDNVKVGANVSFAPGIIVMPNKTIEANRYVEKDIID